MKAISLYQPWATAMAIGAKQIETRGRLTHFRGDLAICAAKKRMTPRDIPIDVHKWMRNNWGSDNLENILVALPYGKVVCVVTVYDCRDAFEVWQAGLIENEAVLGGYHDQGYPCGRFAWMTHNLRQLETPVPVIGHQGLFNLPAAVEAQVMDQLIPV
jgi:hypothetical protein